MAQVETPYVYDTRLKNLIERFVQQIKKIEQNVSMTIIFPVRNRIVIDSMFGTG